MSVCPTHTSSISNRLMLKTRTGIDRLETRDLIDFLKNLAHFYDVNCILKEITIIHIFPFHEYKFEEQ